MIEQNLLKYCYFYKGEALPPFDQNDGRRLLWLTEKWICEEGNELIKPTDPKKAWPCSWKLMSASGRHSKHHQLWNYILQN